MTNKKKMIALALLAAMSASLAPGLAVAKSNVAPPDTSIDPEKEAAHIKEVSVLDDDQNDMDAVQDVCTKCHSSFQYLTTPRSGERWETNWTEMTSYGADPTDEQVTRIVRYFLRNLTIVNVNLSPPEYLVPTLQVSDATANAIIARRSQRKFSGIADLETVPGIKKDVLKKLNTKLQF